MATYRLRKQRFIHKDGAFLLVVYERIMTGLRGTLAKLVGFRVDSRAEVIHARISCYEGSCKRIFLDLKVIEITLRGHFLLSPLRCHFPYKIGYHALVHVVVKPWYAHSIPHLSRRWLL